jgi:hypothetical protein
MRVVRVIDMWGCIGVWILLDFLMIAFGKNLPDKLWFDGKEALSRDIWAIFFILAVWLLFSRKPDSPADREGK